MYYLLTYDVIPEYLEKREQYRESHIELALAAVSRGELRLGGAFTGPSLGAALLFEGNSPQVAEEFATKDPYVLNGLVKSWSINEWSIALGAGVPAKEIDFGTKQGN